MSGQDGTGAYRKIQEPQDMLMWAACPVCDQTWSEVVPYIGDRTPDLAGMVRDDLVRAVRRHREQAHDLLGIVAGFVPVARDDSPAGGAA